MPKKTTKAPKRAKAGRKVGVLPPRHQDTKVTPEQKQPGDSPQRHEDTRARTKAEVRRQKSEGRSGEPGKSRTGKDLSSSDQTKSEARSQKAEVRSEDSGRTRTGKDLLIVESPTKARTIGRLLAGKMHVLSSRGHISDLPKSRLGVDVEHEFEPEYIRIRGKAPVINELKAAARNAKSIFIATDPDREGEAIAYSVAFEIKNGAPIKRVLIYEITPKGLTAALAEPGDIDMKKVDSHRARRVLDRLVGYQVSPLLWKIVRGGLSAGRVQTVALRMLVDREREIQAFKPEEFWT